MRTRQVGSDYARVARAIEHLVAHQAEQPSLGELAGALGLSPFHLQRLFQRWAGVSPKAFLAALTLDRARAALASAPSVLDASLAVGLSGPSRLHDLFVTHAAMTPGEHRDGGAGLTLRYALHDTPLGPALFAATDRGLAALTFVDGPPGPAVDELATAWPNATLVRDPAATEGYAAELTRRLAGQPPRPVGLVLRGRPLQLKVWEALLRVPAGDLVSYGQLAEAVGHERAARAVGSAVGDNPIAVFIPCHRVIRASGALGGYRYGLTRKRALLALEAARTVGTGFSRR